VCARTHMYIKKCKYTSAAAAAFIRTVFFLVPSQRTLPSSPPHGLLSHAILYSAAVLPPRPSGLDTTRMCAWRLSPVRKLPRKNSFSHFPSLHTIRHTHTHTCTRALPAHSSVCACAYVLLLFLSVIPFRR